MPAYKDSKTGTWFVKFYCKDWTGENKQIKKRGFATKREALDYERNYKIRQDIWRVLEVVYRGCEKLCQTQHVAYKRTHCGYKDTSIFQES